MKLLKRILVATDFSETSKNVVDNAIAMAKVFKSEIVLIYVLPEDAGSDKANELLEEFAMRELQSVTARINDEGIETLEPILEKGDFSEKIIKASTRLNVNIIFAGAGEIEEDHIAKLGSNAEKIIMKSSKPVFIVKNDKPLSINRILCPVDFSIESKKSLKNAITLAHKFDASLVILNVFEVSHLFPIKNSIKLNNHLEYMRKSSERSLENFLKNAALSGLDVTKKVAAGKPSKEILDAIKEHDIDFLMMGTTGKSGISKILMGSVTDKVIREVPCSFITMKREDAIIVEIEKGLDDIEHHFANAQELFEDGFYDEAISEYKRCLEISIMHLPSVRGLAEVYKKIGDTENESKYKSMIIQVLDRMNYEKIEADARKFRS